MDDLLDGLRNTRRRVLKAVLGAGGLALTEMIFPGRARGDTGDLATLRRAVAGRVTAREEAGFEAARGSMVWNGWKPTRRPALIVQATSVADVREAVKFAQRHRLKVTVRSGGHHLSGAALRDGGLLVDVSALRELSIGAGTRTAVAQPGVRSQELARKLADHGLAFPVGHCPTVALGGYLLGGGFGWNAGEWGVACWNVTAVDVVTSAGEVVRASQTDHPALFWAARGAGPGFFGAVVGYHLRVFDLPKAIETTTLIYPLEKAAELARWAVATSTSRPRSVELLLVCRSAPPPLAERHPRICVVSATAFAHTHDQAVAALSPVGSCPVEGALAKDLAVPVSFDGLFATMDMAFPAGKRYAGDMLWLSGDAGALVATAAERYERAPSPRSLLLCIVPPPPPADAPPLPDGAFSMVGPINLGCYAIWDDESADAQNIAWLRQTTGALASATIGYYVGETDLFADPSRARRSFSPTSWRRLAELRSKYDPRGVFHGWNGIESRI